MDLKEKLARLKDAGPGSRAPKTKTVEETPPITADDAARLERIERLRTLIDRVMSRSAAEEQAQIVSIDVRPQTLPGGPQDTPFGTVHVAEEHLEPAHCQGRTPIATALDVSSQTLSTLALDPSLAGVDPRGMLFLDTETTGLVGGTGTVPFLVGLARFEDQSMRVEQLFLRQLGCERPLLHRLAERLSSATLLVTYNGKTFDWPLLRTRYVMNQLDLPETPPHLDLLHCARRVYKRRLGECNLVRVEERVLGLRREHDIEGSEIPIRYLDYLRSGNEAQLVPIIEHNAHDLISLAAVVGIMGTHYVDLEPGDEPEDHLGYARLAERAGDRERAISFARAAKEGSGSDDLTVDASLFLARLLMRSGDVDGQERVLLDALEAAGYAGPKAAGIHLALAKVYEHRIKDLERAKKHAEHALGAETDDAHQRRLERLASRLARRAVMG